MIIEKNIFIAAKTSYKVGGVAQYYIKILTQEDCSYAISFSQEKDLPIFVLGRGTNVLVSEYGWHGLVCDFSDFSNILWDKDSAVCQSGAFVHCLSLQAVNYGFSGIEKLAGLPGTIGGGIVINAGAFGQTISDRLVSVTVIDKITGTIRNINIKSLNFGYRSSSLKTSGLIVLSAIFKFSETINSDILKLEYSSILAKRRKKQPLDFPNCGSVFKHSSSGSAGELIEAAGLKGFSVGGAVVSSKHANFIINTGDATSSDIRNCIVAVQRRVYEILGVLLEPEVIFVGKFDTPLYISKTDNKTGTKEV